MPSIEGAVVHFRFVKSFLSLTFSFPPLLCVGAMEGVPELPTLLPPQGQEHLHVLVYQPARRKGEGLLTFYMVNIHRECEKMINNLM